MARSNWRAAILAFFLTPAVYGQIGVFNSHPAILNAPGESAFLLPAGPRGFYKHGFRIENDGTIDLKPYWGVRCDVQLPDAREAELTISVDAAVSNGPDKIAPAVVRLAGRGWHTILLPWSSFQFEQAGSGFLKFG